MFDEVSPRRHRAKLREAGIATPSRSKRQGVHVAGVRGSVRRYALRDCGIVGMRAAGATWVQIGRAVGITRNAARKAWLRATEAA